jgi:hypothetical protein
VNGDLLFVPFNAAPAGGSAGCVGIAVVNTKKMEVTTVWSYPTRPISFVIRPGSKVGYASFSPSPTGSPDLAEIDLSTGQITRGIKLPVAGLAYLAISPDGSTILAADGSLEFAVYAVNTQTFTITATASGLELWNPIVSPDGLYLYGSTRSGIEIFSTASLQMVGAIASSSYAGPVLFVGR